MATMIEIQVSKDYGYVLLTATSSYALLMWLAARIDSFRQAARVHHPSVAASAETIANVPSEPQKRALYLFNCAQRAHYNILENYSSFLTALLISGIKYPKFAAAWGSVWLLGRVIYALAYTSPDAKNVDGRGRFWYGGYHIAALSQVVLALLVGKLGWDLLMA